MRALLLLKILMVAALLAAPWQVHSPAYYQLLRVLLCGGMAYFCFESAIAKQQGWAWLLGSAALLFNPFFPLQFTKNAWDILDVVGAGVLLFSLQWNLILPIIKRRYFIVGLSIILSLCLAGSVLWVNVNRPTPVNVSAVEVSPSPITDCRQISYSYRAESIKDGQNEVKGNVYAYIQGDVRHYSNLRPLNVHCEAVVTRKAG